MTEADQASLEGQVVLITGATRGIGRRLAEELSARGASIGSLSPHAGELSLPRSAFARADVTDAADVRAAVRELEEALGPVDLLVNNAGSVDADTSPPWEADLEQWWRVVETNLRGPMTMCHAVVPRMVARSRGRVLNISTHQVLTPDPDYAAYAASKAALHRLTEAMAHHLTGSGVRVFEVAPDRHQTDLTATMPKWDDFTDWSSYQPLVDLVVGIARGQLDAWSGRWLSARYDRVEDLQRVHAEAGGELGSTRLLRLNPDLTA